MSTKCGLCPMDKTQMTPSAEVPGYCYCPTCKQMHRGIQVLDKKMMEKSTKGSKPFNKGELKQGYRKCG